MARHGNIGIGKSRNQISAAIEIPSIETFGGLEQTVSGIATRAIRWIRDSCLLTLQCKVFQCCFKSHRQSTMIQNDINIALVRICQNVLTILMVFHKERRSHGFRDLGSDTTQRQFPPRIIAPFENWCGCARPVQHFFLYGEALSKRQVYLEASKALCCPNLA